MQTVKMVVTGASGVGKSRHSQTINQINIVSTHDKKASGPQAGTNQATVSTSLGRNKIKGHLVLFLCGTPGQGRFDFLRKGFTARTPGFHVLANSSRTEGAPNVRQILQSLHCYAPPHNVLVNRKQNVPGVRSLGGKSVALKVNREVQVLPRMATEQQHVRNMLLKVIFLILKKRKTVTTRRLLTDAGAQSGVFSRRPEYAYYAYEVPGQDLVPKEYWQAKHTLSGRSAAVRASQMPGNRETGKNLKTEDVICFSNGGSACLQRFSKQLTQ